MLLLLQACSVSYLQLRNEIACNAPPKYTKPCNIKYFISLDGYARRANVGKIYLDKTYEERIQDYINSTQEIIDNKICRASHVEREEESNLKIRIVRSGYRGDAPQDWLTGLSFGLIPSWKTDRDVYEYHFEDVNQKIVQHYYVDQKTFAHLILFPISWITFIMLDDMADYKKSLTSFLEAS